MDQKRFPAGLLKNGSRSGPTEVSPVGLAERIQAVSELVAGGRPQLSVVIIAYNEEDRIRQCIESVFTACRGVDDFEVILVDSNSTDRTVEYATEYPITVLRIPSDDLTTPSAGRYVGTQAASGETLLFVDGDMTLTETWLPLAVDYLETHDDVAAVEGHLNESTETEVQTVDDLGGIMLCDADALDEVGGFEPFLLSNEDIDVGFQLTTAGYRLVCLPEVSVIHHDDDTIAEPFRRWRHGYFFGPGQMIRKWLDSPQILMRLLRRQQYKLGLLVWVLLGGVAVFVTPLLVVWTLCSAIVFAVVASRLGTRSAVNFFVGKALGIVGLVVGLNSPPPPAEAFPLSAVEVVATGRKFQATEQRSGQ